MTEPLTIRDAVVRLRERHLSKGHSPTNRVGYCAEANGISAVWCDDGIYLAALAEIAVEQAFAALDVDRLAQAMTEAAPRRPGIYAEAEAVAAEYARRHE